MKFSNSLKFNAVAEWQSEYIDYDALKRKIYEIESVIDASRFPRGRSTERSALLSRLTHVSQSVSTDDQFVPMLDRELAKIVNFYRTQEHELKVELEELAASITRREEEGPNSLEHRFSDDGDSDDDDISYGDVTMSRNVSASRWRRKHSISVGSPVARRQHRSSERAGHDDLEAGSEQAASPISPVTASGQPPEDSSRNKGSTRSRRPTISKIITHPRAALAEIFTPSEAKPETIWSSKSATGYDLHMLFKRRISNIYGNATNLKSYVELNHSGFRKILKKYDKITERELKDKYMHERVETSYPFLQETKSRLSDMISQLVMHYATCVTGGDTSAAANELKTYQREQIIWERDTVWRQMIGKERRGEVDGRLRSLITVGGRKVSSAPLISLPTPLGTLRIYGKHVSFIAAVVAFTTILKIRIVDGAEANRCLAILVFATILWATEAIPLFVTSISVPLLVAVLRVTRTPKGKEMSAKEATNYIFSVMFSPTIMLLLGGFTLSSALSKVNVDRVLITRVLSLAGTRPSTVILSFMGVACFASMWISNVAAPSLCFALIRPILASLPPKSTFAPCLIMAIALAANIGGQSSPISSPQNIIALDQMDVPLDWLQWFVVALPVSGVSILLIWLLLLAIYRPGTTSDGEPLSIKPVRANREKFDIKQYYVAFVCIVTIALWCLAHQIQWMFGDMGIIAIIPIVAFFGTGILSKADFDQFLWSIVFLAMGGIALGKAVVSSGLLDTMDVGIRHLVSGLQMYEVVLTLSAVVLVVSTFISHTIASVLLVPIASEVGKKLPGSHSRLLIFVTGLVCSTGMGMPVSGFPNQTAATQEDDMGQLYLSNVDFLKCGVPASIIAALVVSTVGYLLMNLIGL